jgi:hypothetical protein
MTTLDVPLYHGTSTLFLAPIIEGGLGAQDVIAQWRVLELARHIHPLVEAHLAGENRWMLEAQSFGWMCEQRTSNFNFQHGHAYLSPSEQTAIGYAVKKRYGSELLSYTLVLLEELIRRGLVERDGDISREFSEAFYLLRRNFAPMLIEVADLAVESLLDEHGDNPQSNLDLMAHVRAHEAEIADVLLQQTNFRLVQVAPLSSLTFWLLDFGLGRTGIAKRLIHVPGARNAVAGAPPQA